MGIERCPICGCDCEVFDDIGANCWVQCESEDCPYEAGERYDTKEAIRAHNDHARAIRDRITRARREALEDALLEIRLHSSSWLVGASALEEIEHVIRALMEEEATDRHWIKHRIRALLKFRWHLARQRIIRFLWWLYRRIGDVVVLRVTTGWPAPREYVVRVRDLEEEDE